MTWGLWHAIHAMVDVHAKFNREALLHAVKEQRDKHPRPKGDDSGLVQGR